MRASVTLNGLQAQCAGLRLIPGMTKSGLQKEKTPERKFLEFLTGSKDEDQ